MLTLRMSRPVSHPPTLSIVGAGRLGRSLARRFRRLGYPIATVVTRSPATARSAVRFIGAGQPYASLTREILRADVILLTVPDGALAAVARSLAQIERKSWRGKVVLHTSGALDRTVLNPLAKRGAATGSMHPMQTFSGHSDPEVRGVVFGIEGDVRARREAVALTRTLGAIPVTIDGRHKIQYHAAAAMVAGLGLALTEGATQVLLSLGFSRQKASKALLPLMREMLKNFEKDGPHAAWTGPISRSDFGTIALHAKALSVHPKELQQAYAALARLSARVLAKNYRPTLNHLNKALASPRRKSK
jgi:predicted short-subunit dehydrogenase-like oxidoreductase (DUF2520 family)